MHETACEMRWEDKKFTAALKGIDLDKGRTSEADEVIRRAEAKALNMSEEQLELDGMFNFEYEDGD
jgi:hypothetical protein